MFVPRPKMKHPIWQRKRVSFLSVPSRNAFQVFSSPIRKEKKEFVLRKKELNLSYWWMVKVSTEVVAIKINLCWSWSWRWWWEDVRRTSDGSVPKEFLVAAAVRARSAHPTKPACHLRRVGVEFVKHGKSLYLFYICVIINFWFPLYYGSMCI